MKFKKQDKRDKTNATKIDISDNEQIDLPMTDRNKLVVIKAVHTIVWLFFNVVIFYMAYAVLINRIYKWFWICLTLVLLETVILLVFKRICPITIIARKYATSNNANFDIYLPNWLARHNKEIYSSIVLITVLILLYRLLTNNA